MFRQSVRRLFSIAILSVAFGSMGAIAPATAQQHYGVKTTVVDDVVWAYRDKGDGPVAVLLHAYIGDSTLWLDQLDDLKDIRRVIAPDLRGFGMSEPVRDEHIDSVRLAADLATFLDSIGVTGKVDLVTLSGSTLLAGLFYENHPDRVASLTIMSGAFDWTLDSAYQRYQADLARLIVVEGKEPVFRRFDEYIRGNGASLFARARYKTMLLNMRSEMIVAALLNMKQSKPRPDLPAKIKVPVLFPLGTQDSVISAQRIAQVKAGFSDTRVVQIRGAGRLLPLEAPDALNAALRDFWTGDAKRK